MATAKKAADAATKQKAAKGKTAGAAKKPVAAKAEETKAASASTKTIAAKKAASTKKAATAASAQKTAAPAKTVAAKAKATTTKTPAAKKATAGEKSTTAKKTVPAKKTAATAKAAPAKTTAAAKKAEPAQKSVPAKAEEPAKKAELAKQATSTKEEKPTEKTEPAKKKASAKKAEPAKKTATSKKAATLKKAASAKKTTPAKRTEPAKEVQPAKKAVPAAKQGEAVKEAKPDAKAQSTKEAKPDAKVKSTKEAKPAGKAQSVKEPKPVEAEKPAGSAQVIDENPAQAPEFADVPGVLIAAAECAPLVKVGGLADVVGALPKYLEKIGVDARVIMPLHRQIKERYFAQMQHLCDFEASLGWRSQYVGVEKAVIDGVTYYFIDNEFYFGGPIYCGGEFEGEQYAFFTRAVMDAIPQLDFDVQILHCNDWHTAMMPLLARTQYQGGVQERLRTLLTIHNLHFQGQFSHEFDRDLLRVDDSLATPQFIEHYGCDNMLKAGIVFANKVNTVSPTYAHEICEPYLGESLDGVLRSRGGDLWGILNGIDYDAWDPQTDKNLPANYSSADIRPKRVVRDALLEELGLQPVGENTAVIGMVGRLTPQKGIDLVRHVLDELMGEDVRVIVLGSGYPEYEKFLREAEWRHKGRLCSFIGYAAELSHRIYAGSDLFLMPSKFEPCGISQMISMRYGTLPIVRETGGLKDTVVPYNEFTGEGNGFSFANYNAHEMLGCIRYALSVWRNPDVRKQLITHAMETDFSFERCARTYAELYRSL